MRVFVALVFVVVSSTAAFAFGGGSPYTVFGIGDLRMDMNPRSAGMGYTGIALATPNSINSFSPATWIGINRTRIDVGLLYEGFKSTDGSRSLYLARGDFNGAVLAVPVSPARGIAFVAGVVPYSGTQYNIFSSGAQLGTEYSINYVGHGGLAKAEGGLSWSLTDYFAIGASLNYLFGNIYHQQNFLSVPGSILVGQQNDQTSARGVTTTIGGLFTGFDKISGSLHGLSLGFVLTSRGNLKTEQQIFYQYQASGEEDTSAVIPGRFVVPVSFGLGLSYQAGGRYVVAADYVTQPWASGTLNAISPGEFRNSTRAGFGGERLPSKDVSARWFDRLAYRIGAYYNSTYYSVNGASINEWAMTAGLGLPLTGETHMNVALQYGSRGTTDAGLVKENFLRVIFSLSISEEWFQRIEEE